MRLTHSEAELKVLNENIEARNRAFKRMNSKKAITGDLRHGTKKAGELSSSPRTSPKSKGKGHPVAKKQSKYRNKKVEHREGGEIMRFDSRKEFARYLELKQMERDGKIHLLTRQVPFPIKINGKLICKYVADFTYKKNQPPFDDLIVEDVKGFKTAIYRLKKKLMEAVLLIDIIES